MGKLISTLPIGSLVKELDTKYNNKPIVWRIIDKNHSGYPSGSITLMSDKIITLKCVDAKEPQNSDSNRKQYGNNRYIHSNLRKWLNSQASAGGWYSAQHGHDAPPTNENVNSGYNEYQAEAGFLNNFSLKFLNAIKTTNLQAGKANVDGGGIESFSDKIFLASCTEMGLSGDHVCGVKFQHFNSDSSRVAMPTQECINNSEYTSSSLAANKAWYYWLRDAYASNSLTSRYVHSSGSLSNTYSFYGHYGVRPLCNLDPGILVSDSPDSDGAYTVVWNQAPVIDGNNSSLGEKTGAFQKSYVASDADDATIEITERINSTQKRKFSATQGEQNAFEVTQNEFIELENGSHSIQIEAKDSSGNITKRTYSFTKNAQEVEFELLNPLPADDIITKAIIHLIYEKPLLSEIIVKACNNANDTEPTWEDVTNAVLGHNKFFFKNKTKTATNWGFNVKISIKRNESQGDLFVYSIGGNFE